MSYLDAFGNKIWANLMELITSRAGLITLAGCRARVFLFPLGIDSLYLLAKGRPVKRHQRSTFCSMLVFVNGIDPAEPVTLRERQLSDGAKFQTHYDDEKKTHEVTCNLCGEIINVRPAQPPTVWKGTGVGYG
ncbi:hypothetical protein DFH09DRAFT_1092307 [Mycena vulgaris]|nr:hypothetical protein DFH09DRAFT_1092307 [Mycena vulgaris]